MIPDLSLFNSVLDFEETEAPKFTAGLSISFMNVPLWLATFWSDASI